VRHRAVGDDGAAVVVGDVVGELRSGVVAIRVDGRDLVVGKGVVVDYRVGLPGAEEDAAVLTAGDDVVMEVCVAVLTGVETVAGTVLEREPRDCDVLRLDTDNGVGLSHTVEDGLVRSRAFERDVVFLDVDAVGHFVVAGGHADDVALRCGGQGGVNLGVFGVGADVQGLGCDRQDAQQRGHDSEHSHAGLLCFLGTVSD
jgi:hypothetical protein